MFNIISFPFLFGVMFGDIMHGTLLLIFAIWLCYADRSNSSSLASVMAPVRYIFLLMGLFATYMGFIYNDFTSTTTMTFGATCYDKIEEGTSGAKYLHKTDSNCVYPFGMDPIWYRTEQEISFMNSFKMKISVIFGVAQMVLGTTLKAFNAVHKRNWIVFFFEAVSQLVLINVLFGLMDLFIIVKW